MTTNGSVLVGLLGRRDRAQVEDGDGGHEAVLRCDRAGHEFGAHLERHRYETAARADVLDDQRITWTMTYRTLTGDDVLREDTATFDCYVISDHQLHAELDAAGCQPVTDPPAGVLAWDAPG